MKGQTAQGIVEIVLAPEGAVLLAQNHIGFVPIDAEHHPHGLGYRRPEGLDELRLVGQLFPPLQTRQIRLWPERLVRTQTWRTSPVWPTSS